MLIAKIVDGDVVLFPCSREDIEAEISAQLDADFRLPRNLDGLDLSEYDYLPVEETPLDRAGPVETFAKLIGDTWVQAWRSLPETETEVAARFAQAKLDKRAAVNALRDAKEVEVAPTPFGAVDSDPTSSKRLEALRGMALTAIITQATWNPLEWTMADNSKVLIDVPAKALQLAGAVTQFGAQLHAHASALKSDIDAAEDFAALGLVEINDGWPG